jgi:hypothetical protein
MIDLKNNAFYECYGTKEPGDVDNCKGYCRAGTHNKALLFADHQEGRYQQE